MLPRRADHASVALRFAIAVLDAAHQVPTGDGDETLRLRVGVHTGSVTAGSAWRPRGGQSPSVDY